MSDPNLSGFTEENSQFVKQAVLNLSQPSRRSQPLKPVRFVQASDFCLDTPCFGVANLPEEFRERFVDARFRAAERVFDAAIEHGVDFVVLAGGLLDASLPGLRAPWFLAEQFRRLANHNIDVYWAGATFEPGGRWPSHLPIPPNVHHLGMDQTSILHGPPGQPTARLLVLPSSGKTPHIPKTDALTIGVLPRLTTKPDELPAGVDYWALGGQPNYETVQIGDAVAHFAGSPQGRWPQEVGQHSCSLVNVDSTGGVHIQPIATNVVRWHHRCLEIGKGMSWTKLMRRLALELTNLPADESVELSLVTWTVTGGGPTIQRLVDPRSNAELTDRLNSTSASLSPPIWNVGIEAVVESSQREDWKQQATPLGAFLRELQELSGQVPHMLGTPATEPHAGPANKAVDTEQILDGATSEGIHRLIGEESLVGPAV